MPGGFSFNGTHCNVFGLKLLKYEDPLMPPVKDRKEEVPGKEGAWDFGFDYGPRPLSIEVAFRDDTRAGLKAVARQIAGWLNPRSGIKELRFDDESEKFYLARVVGNIPLEFIIGAYSEFTINFVAYDPMAYGDEIIWLDIVDAGTFKVNNPGTTETRPLIIIQALDGLMPGDVCLTGGYDPAAVIDTLTNPILYLNGKTIQYIGTIDPGESLLIDCSKLQAIKGGLNALPAISGEFPELGPGDNNLTMADETSTGGGIVKIQFRGRWL